MLAAWSLRCLMPACCLMLEQLPNPSTKGGILRLPPTRRDGLRPPPLRGIICAWVWQMFKHQATSSKQASGIKQQPSSIKQQTSRNWTLRDPIPTSASATPQRKGGWERFLYINRKILRCPFLRFFGRSCSHIRDFQKLIRLIPRFFLTRLFQSFRLLGCWYFENKTF